MVVLMIAKKKDKLLGLKQRTFPFSFSFSYVSLCRRTIQVIFFLKIVRELILNFLVKMANFDQVYLFIIRQAIEGTGVSA